MSNLSLIELKSLNGLKLEAYCTELKKINKFSAINELSEIVGDKSRLVVGHGSNIFFLSSKKNPLCSTLILNQLKGIQKLEERNNRIFIKCFAGENWNDFVLWTLRRNISGLENLILIPGTVGAAPVQNIGAYGVEVASRISSVTTWDFTLKKIVTFKTKDCSFEYRNSIFKNQMLSDGWSKTRYLILSVDFMLWRENKAPLVTHYLGIMERIEGQPTSKKIAEVIKQIRENKLPNPNKLPNVGSFFQNPRVEKALVQELKKKYPLIPEFDKNNSSSKLSAAWLIEKSNFKGYRVGDAGTYDKHSLIVVNHGRATSYQVMKLAMEIQNTIFKNYGVWLIPEPSIISSYERITYSLKIPRKRTHSPRN